MKPGPDRPYFWLFATLAFVGLVADQTSKYFVFAKLYPGEAESRARFDVIPNYFALQTNYSFTTDPGDQPLSFLRTISGVRLPEVNRGALFGWGNGDAESGGMNYFFALISVLAGCFIVFWVSRPAVVRDRFLCLALGMILGGTIGNFYDRIVFGGVRDFLHVYYESHIWPDFNIADCCLVCGACVLLMHSFLVSEPTNEPAVAETSAATMPAASPTNGV